MSPAEAEVPKPKSPFAKSTGFWKGEKYSHPLSREERIKKGEIKALEDVLELFKKANTELSKIL